MKVPKSQEPTLPPVTNKTLYKLPHHRTNTPVWHSMAPLYATKQTGALIPLGPLWKECNILYSDTTGVEDFHETKAEARWIWILEFAPSESCCSAINTGLMWLILQLLLPDSVLRKPTLMPFSLLYRHFLCATLAPCFVVFSSSLFQRDITTENINYVPVGTAVCPLSVLAEDEQRRYSKTSKSESGTMIFTGIRKGHAGKTGSLITTRHAAGTVISPGALKDRAKHLRGGKNVTKDRTTALSEHIGGTSILLSA